MRFQFRSSPLLSMHVHIYTVPPNFSATLPPGHCSSGHSLTSSTVQPVTFVAISSEHNTVAGVDMKQEVEKAVLNAMSLNEEVNGSQRNL